MKRRDYRKLNIEHIDGEIRNFQNGLYQDWSWTLSSIKTYMKNQGDK